MTAQTERAHFLAFLASFVVGNRDERRFRAHINRSMLAMYDKGELSYDAATGTITLSDAARIALAKKENRLQ